MLCILPRLEWGEEHGGGDASKDPADEEPGVAGGQLRQTAEGVDHGERYSYAPEQWTVKQKFHEYFYNVYVIVPHMYK